MKTAHRDGCTRVFKSYDLDCPRCQELASGAKPRRGWGDSKREFEAQSLRAIRTHDCKRAGCGLVCTFGDW
jgi:hypothetical protein